MKKIMMRFCRFHLLKIRLKINQWLNCCVWQKFELYFHMCLLFENQHHLWAFSMFLELNEQLEQSWLNHIEILPNLVFLYHLYVLINRQLNSFNRFAFYLFSIFPSLWNNRRCRPRIKLQLSPEHRAFQS